MFSPSSLRNKQKIESQEENLQKQNKKHNKQKQKQLMHKIKYHNWIEIKKILQRSVLHQEGAPVWFLNKKYDKTT